MTARSLFRRHGPAWLVATALAAVAVAMAAGPPASSQPGSAGTKANPDEKAAAASANKLVQQQSGDLKASDRDEFKRHKVITTNDGLQYVPYTRTYQDLPVVGGDFVVVTDAKGNVRSTSVQQQQEIGIGTSPKLTKAKAEAIARKKLDKVDEATSKLVVHAIDGTRLAYEVELRGTKKNLPRPMRVWVDALNGKVLRTLDLVADGEGTGKWNGPPPLSFGTTGSAGNYQMKDPNKGNVSCGGSYQQKDVYTDSDDKWGDGVGTNKVTGCADAMFVAGKEWDMWKEWLGRDGVNGSGGMAPVYMGDPYGNNAHWYSEGYITIGYNSKNEWISSLDVVAHEFGHGLDQYTPGGFSGGPLQEHLADVMGAAAESYANEPAPYDTPDDYLVGETVNLTGSGPIRNMAEPSKVNNDPNCWSTSLPTQVHAAAGPGNHWFYLVAEGTNPGGGKPTSPTCNNAGTLTGIGIKAATKIVYNAMLRKTSGANYQTYRTWTLGAAKDLDPTCTQFNKVKAAWDAVSVPAQTADPTCTGGGDTQAPTAPGNLRSTGKTSTSVSLAWDASTDNVGVTEYDVYNGSVKATTVSGTSATVSGLTAGTSYTFTVKARDAASNTSPASNAVSVTTDGGGGGGGLTNGGFEAGALSSWTTGGTAKAASLVNSGAHGGTYAARLGSTSETNGESTLSQTFTVPAGSSELSFWYNITCPDTVTYAWAKATLTNTSTGATTTPLAKTCTNGQGWKQATTPVIAGNTYTLTLVNRDDNHPDDPVYTLFDDISAGTGTPGGNEFSVSVDPASLSVQKGQSTSTTVKTAVTSGSAQTVKLSASGLPSGASATFSPSSVNAGDGAKLTISTTSATPDGTSTVTITGDGTEVDRSTTLSLTVGGGDPNPGTLKQISKDIYTNTESQHATQVEPDAASWGNTIVSAQQTGRQYNGGATTLAWSTSTDGGVTWQDGNLSGITKHVGSGPHDRTTDPVVAYSAKHSTWLIGTTPMNNSGSNWVGQGMKVVRSADGLNWSAPIVAVPAVSGKNFDKSSFGCDNNSSSPRYGTCYAVIDDLSNSNALSIVTSTDGGQTWSTPVIPSGVTWPMPNGLITQPDGTVVIIYMRVQGGNDIMATVSKDGGKTWSNGSIVQHVKWHNKPGGELRGNPLPSMDVDAAGKIYLAWPDCQFRTDTCSDSSNNSRNDILLTTSTDGVTWSAPKRIPIAESDANMDRYIPEITVDHSTSGANAKIGLHYYFIEDGACSSNCPMKVGYLSSANGGTSWSSPQTVAGPFGMHTLADTNQGRMIGEYTGAAFVNGKVVGAFPVGRAPTDGKAFDQGIYTFGPMAITGGVNLAGPAPAGASAKAANSQQTLRKVVG